ncbi:hypothetical protein EMN47_11055 [Prolixibacteraceae bacterium JC049]|nr:hypothetical protein [Prolixibacteraceae bacterium JC049]
MKSIYLLLVVLLLPGYLLAQIKFTPGYVITSKNERKQCLLLNTGIEHSGGKYIYKLHKDSASNPVEVEQIKAFGVDDGSQFIRHKVKLDISGSTIKNLKDTLNHAQWQEGHVFLEEMIASKAASLYYFTYEGNDFFFYKKGVSKIQHLIFKKYELEISSGLTSQIFYDNRFKEQLKLNMPCAMKTSGLSYTRKSLMRYFKTYIREQNIDINTEVKEQKGKFKVQLAFLSNSSSFKLEEKQTMLSYDFGSENSISFGIGAEYLFPFNRNKWGLFVEGNYVDCSFSFSSSNTPFASELSYKHIDIPVGLIHYFNLSDDLRLYVKGGLCTSVKLDSKFTIGNSDYNRDTSESTSLLVGVGVNYKRFSAEFKAYSAKDIVQNLSMYKSEYKQMQIRLAYDLFRK